MPIQNPEGIVKTVGRQRPQHVLISTKINRPAVVEKWVKRPRLISRLNEGLKDLPNNRPCEDFFTHER